MAEQLPPYRRAVRPVMPDSFPRYVEGEFDKISRALDAHRALILDLQAQVAALSTP